MRLGESSAILLAFCVSIGCSFADSESAGHVDDAQLGEHRSQIALDYSNSWNAPCVFSGPDATGVKQCFTGLGRIYVGPFRSFYIGNSSIRFTTSTGSGVSYVGAYVRSADPRYEVINVPENSGRYLEIVWQGANTRIDNDAIVLAATNFPGGNPYCLDVHGQAGNGTQVGIVPCNSQVFQKWKHSGTCSPALSGSSGELPSWDFPCNYYRIEALAFNKCLDAAAPPAQGARIQTWDCNNQSQQAWREDLVDSSYGPRRVYFSVPANTVGRLYLDVQNANISPWNPVWQWPYNGGYAQIWMNYGAHASGYFLTPH